MKKYGLFTRFVTKESKRDELASILLEVSKRITAKGLHQYIIYNDVNDPNCVCVSEIWDSKADHDHSLSDPGNKENIACAMPLMAGKPESTELEVLAGIK